MTDDYTIEPMATTLRAEAPPSSRRGMNSAPSRILEALRADGGELRPAEVASLTGLTTHVTANALKVLTESGEAVRLRNPHIRNGPGASVYKAAPWDDGAESG